MRLVDDDQVGLLNLIQASTKSLNRCNHSGLLRHGFVGLNESVRDRDSGQGCTDLIEDLAAVGDDNNPRASLKDPRCDVAEEDCLSGSSRADYKWPFCPRHEGASDIVCQTFLVGSQFHHEP